ncbi:MAG: pyridoxamine 5'-phosphate oxidase family protein [Dorea sp.]|nr:pyridoxamine 5'-phosphate oxidase family protein [Dorea sp.]
MRRKDREVTVSEEIRQVLEACKVCRIGMLDHGKPYIVPMNMGYDYDEKTLTIYFHCAREGRKLELLRENAQVAFEMDKEIALVEGDTPCQYSFRYASIMGTGKAEIVEDELEKADALAKIMKHQTGRDFDVFAENPKMARAVAIIKVSAAEYSCKRND